MINSFRPLSGSYISQYSKAVASRTKALVSVPYRGATFLNLRLGFLIRLLIMVSVPYRGATFLNIAGADISPFSTKVSVPYRGATFLNDYVFFVCDAPKTFPSPIGELHFSIPSPQPHVLSGTNRGIAGEK